MMQCKVSFTDSSVSWKCSICIIQHIYSKTKRKSVQLWDWEMEDWLCHRAGTDSSTSRYSRNENCMSSRPVTSKVGWLSGNWLCLHLGQTDVMELFHKGTWKRERGKSQWLSTCTMFSNIQQFSCQFNSHIQQFTIKGWWRLKRSALLNRVSNRREFSESSDSIMRLWVLTWTYIFFS